LQDHGGGRQPISHLARKLDPSYRGNTYSTYDLDALGVCDAAKHWRCYLIGCSKILVVADHNTQRHLLKQPQARMNKRQARYLRGLQPLVDTVALVYRKVAMCEGDSLSRKPYFLPLAATPKFRDGEVLSIKQLRVQASKIQPHMAAMGVFWSTI
jgi:hypothetical protein